MNFNKKFWTMTLSAAMAASLLAGCGTSGSSADASASGSQGSNPGGEDGVFTIAYAPNESTTESADARNGLAKDLGEFLGCEVEEIQASDYNAIIEALRTGSADMAYMGSQALALAMSATTVAAILAFFVALFGSEKVSPFPRFAKVVRGFATFLRNIPALVWAFILFSSLGIGTGVGFVALCITSFAFMVRAFVETMEDVSQDCVESLQAVGATFPQRVAQAILPSCLSGFLSWFLYCVEVNIRASTIVGMVGGGGVGLTLFSYIKSFRYDIALTIILLIAAMVIVVDQITGKLRKELLK